MTPKLWQSLRKTAKLCIRMIAFKFKYKAIKKYVYRNFLTRKYLGESLLDKKNLRFVLAL